MNWNCRALTWNFSVMPTSNRSVLMTREDWTKRIRSHVQTAAMSSSPNLRIDWCTYDAARYAVEHWHYSRSLPCSKTARLGVWEDGKFIGAIVFAWGANRHLAGEYKLKMTECAELCRIALGKHITPVSRIISIAVKLLKREM